MRDPHRRGPCGAGLSPSHFVNRGRCRSGRAFTLIELLIVVLIVGLLVGLLLPAMRRSRDAARSVACMAKLRTIQVSARVYADAYRQLPLTMPEKAIADFELPAKSWRCEESRLGRTIPLSELGYSTYYFLAVFYMDPPASGIDLSRMKPVAGLRRYEQNPGLPLFWDTEENHRGGRNVVYWNGAAGAWVD